MWYDFLKQGTLIPFANGGYTPCYPKSNLIGHVTQGYRATLVDLVGQPILNDASATTFPMLFSICPECCPTIN